MSVGVVAHQFGQLVSAHQQLLQRVHEVGVRVEEDLVGHLSNLRGRHRCGEGGLGGDQK